MIVIESQFKSVSQNDSRGVKTALSQIPVELDNTGIEENPNLEVEKGF